MTSARTVQASHRRSAVWKENQHRGTTSWEITKPAFNHDLEGYASATSVAAGETLDVHVSTGNPHYTATVYRMGWYQGRGGRLLKTIRDLPGHLYPIPAPDPQTGLVECDWPVSFSLDIPSTWLSGIYLVKLTGSSGIEAWVPFVVRSTTPAKFIFVHAVNTDEAYNEWGGTSLYGNSAYAGKPPVTVGTQRITASLYHRAVEVSFDRPFSDDAGAGDFFLWEYHMVRWLERHGYDVGYVSDVDLEAHPDILRGAKAILIVGHDEYWTRGMRDGVQAAVNAGVNLGVFAGNTLSWQARYQPSADNPDGILVCYKDASPSAAGPDPDAGTPLETTYWSDRPVDDPESELLGDNFGGLPAGFRTGKETFPWVVSDASSWVYRGTGLHDGSTIPQLIGDEYDNVLPDLPHPTDLQVLATSPVQQESGDGLAQQNATLYTADSGARVFDAGEIDWPFGLDPFSVTPYGPNHPEHQDPISHALRAVQTVTANLLRNFSRRGTLHPPALSITMHPAVTYDDPGTVAIDVSNANGTPVTSARVELDARSAGAPAPVFQTTGSSGDVAFPLTDDSRFSYLVVTVWSGPQHLAVTHYFVLTSTPGAERDAR